MDDKTMALLAFAAQLSERPHTIMRSDWEALLAAGWSRQEAIEAVHVVGLFAYANRVADGFGMESRGVDEPFILEDLHHRPQRYE